MFRAVTPLSPACPPLATECPLAAGAWLAAAGAAAWVVPSRGAFSAPGAAVVARGCCSVDMVASGQESLVGWYSEVGRCGDGRWL